jgi:hypothetical protein
MLWAPGNSFKNTGKTLALALRALKPGLRFAGLAAMGEVAGVMLPQFHLYWFF